MVDAPAGSGFKQQLVAVHMHGSIMRLGYARPVLSTRLTCNVPCMPQFGAAVWHASFLIGRPCATCAVLCNVLFILIRLRLFYHIHTSQCCFFVPVDACLGLGRVGSMRHGD
jgi:hypothetical protein